jgi:hypothetical protein
LWRAAGLEHVDETGLELRMNFSSFDDYWLPYLTGDGRAGVYLEKLSPEHRDALGAAVRKNILAGRPDGPFSFDAQAWAVRGTVPA